MVPDAAELLQTASYLPPERLATVERAFEFAARAHEGQTRASGEPYITHPLAAAVLVAGLQMDAPSLQAALLHDTVEDTQVTLADLETEFGGEVARLVEGTTKLSKVHLQGTVRPEDVAIQAENLRKMFLAMAEDIRVVIVKLCDRLHNMRTLDALPPEKRRRIARETLEIYAPLASRLGIWQIKWELEDLSFRHLEPEKYKQIATLLTSKRTTRERFIERVTHDLREELARHGVEGEVTGRAKHIFSIHNKMQRYAAQGRSFNEIYDLMAVRVLVNTVGDCYNALGVVHSLWRPLPGQFDDYIANPKESMYQSLHTSVLGPSAHPLEVQIRTHEMHQVAEYGIAAHWQYKEGGKRNKGYEERVAWLRQLLEWQQSLSGAEEFVESVKQDIFNDQVFVYTPKGDVKDLPSGSTPIDFAYRIHTELGHFCVGARVNGRLVPLTYVLQNGDVVQILTSKSSKGPSRDWLNPHLGYINTNASREKVRAWFKRQQRAENIERGSIALDKELRRLGLSIGTHLDDLLKAFKVDNLEDLQAMVGYGEVTSALVGSRLAALQQPIEEIEAVQPQRQTSKSTSTPSIRVLGTGDLLTQIARCCQPVPGDPIMGYITRSRGVTIHRRDCHNIIHEDERERLVEVEWGHRGELYQAAILIEAWDRVGLLRDITQVVSEERVNMVGVRAVEEDDHTVQISMTLDTTGLGQLARLLNRLETVRGVIAVTRAREAIT